MKKLMFAAAVMAVGAAMAVESGVVGYTCVDGEAGTMAMNGVQFKGVATGVLDLQDIVPNDWDYYDDIRQDDFVISWFDGFGLRYAYWCPELKDSEGNPLNKAGWGDSSLKIVTKTFEIGEAFWVDPNGGLSAPFIQTAGEVETNEGEFNTIEFLEAGTMSQVCNPLPGVATDLQSIVPWDNVYEDDIRQDDFVISWFDGFGLRYAYWCPELKDAEGNDLGKPGWGDSTLKIVVHTFLPGAGFWVDPNGGLAEPVLRFPNPLAK